MTTEREMPVVGILDDVTGEQVKEAVLASESKKILHHRCSMCSYPVQYLVDSENLFFDRGCDCVRHPSELEQVDWQDPADWINMQGDLEARATLMLRFGFKVEV